MENTRQIEIEGVVEEIIQDSGYEQNILKIKTHDVFWNTKNVIVKGTERLADACRMYLEKGNRIKIIGWTYPKHLLAVKINIIL